ncbi:hypothetical protein T492DRAFT_1040687 [Pavlovales sp. CCMP2436]|nr:hypothetical protein T492DRAFT_1040687 [Pavlovales sp. CCMP2436]
MGTIQGSRRRAMVPDRKRWLDANTSATVAGGAPPAAGAGGRKAFEAAAPCTDERSGPMANTRWARWAQLIRASCDAEGNDECASALRQMEEESKAITPYLRQSRGWQARRLRLRQARSGSHQRCPGRRQRHDFPSSACRACSCSRAAWAPAWAGRSPFRRRTPARAWARARRRGPARAATRASSARRRTRARPP